MRMTGTDTSAPVILSIDDELRFRESIRNYLEDYDYQVIEAENGRVGLEVFAAQRPDLVLVDLRMPEVDGLEVLDGVRMASPETPIIVVSGTGLISDVVEALRLGAWDYIFKPIEDLSVLGHAIQKCLERARLIRENKAYQQNLEEKVALRTGELQTAVQRLEREVDIRTEAEKALRKSEEKFREIFEGSRDAIILAAPTGRAVEANEAAASLTGLSREGLLELPVLDLFSEDSRTQAKPLLEGAMNGEPASGEGWFDQPDGRLAVEYSAKSVRIGDAPYLLFTARDISERKQARDRIQASLREKEILLKEIHHRVKNNMQIISSLLNLQAEYVVDNQAKDLFIESRNRIASMALVHEELYRSKDMSRVELRDYVEKLLPRLLYSYGGEREIQQAIEVDEARVTIRQAIPLGLIINELVTNSLKHAFMNREHGVIGVSIRQSDGRAHVRVHDDGVGLPPTLDIEKTQTLGMQLVTGLISQLYGELRVEREGGTAFCIDFPLQLEVGIDEVGA
jgi:PAS domain S-box-containing protein